MNTLFQKKRSVSADFDRFHSGDEFTIHSLIAMFDAKKEDARFCLSFHVAESGILLREFLHAKGISKRTLTATKYDGGDIRVNGFERNVRHPLQAGDEVLVCFPPERPSPGLHPENGVLNIVFEDDALIIINKPAGQSTIPSRDHPTGTVANALAGKFAHERLPSTVHVVTRLDRDTSGLICVAKNRHIHHLLSEQMTNSGFHRQYVAIVEGHINQDKFTINKPIGRKDGSIIERVVREDGQAARTDVEVLGRSEINGHDLTEIALILHTGRTHQIRVHMQWAGFPLHGDDLYGGNHGLIGRQALHCAAIKFTHPLTGEKVEFSCESPPDMKRLMNIEINQTK
ncbi:RluA family pseudouridine synthase [Sporosarcina sp. JAI121]|uniref:RluA family pseudouridine synthase n=1 Tax=Sporosarcina sp. JAI121 TaxID=2723064 RepID=UPI001837D129|nr:RluA family pseudouridine synthase [Sporosarcina sp. JAI121]NYF24006.1 23S rRNA pseudouridine1911/1915/1917 synthase [Sporosarcina sp. JAI121]